MHTIDISTAWAALDEQQQSLAAQSLWKNEFEKYGGRPRENSLGEHLVAALAAVRGFRPKGILKLTSEQRRRELLAKIDTPQLQQFKTDLVREWLLSYHRATIIAFLDAAGIPHDNGMLSGELDSTPAEKLQAGIRAAFSTTPPLAAAVYITYTLLDPSDWSALLPEAISAEKLDLIAILKPRSKAPLPDLAPEPQAKPIEHPGRPSFAFTLLDRMLIRETVASAMSMDRALSPEELDELISEVVELNAGRTRTLFSKGLSDAMHHRKPTFRFPGENEERRVWYFSGVLMGLIRTGDPKCVTECMREQSTLMKALISRTDLPCGAELLPAIHPILLESRQFEPLRNWTRKHARNLSVQEAQRLTYRLQDEGERLLRTGSAAEAMILFEAVEAILRSNASLSEGFTSHFMLINMRRRAQVHQTNNNSEVARSLLNEVVSRGTLSDITSSLGDLGLIDGGFVRLEDILPRKTEMLNGPLCRSLEKGLEKFRRAVELSPESSLKANFCLGVLNLLDKPGSAITASLHLGRAYGEMLRRQAAYSESGLLETCAFLHGIATLETLDEANSHAIRTNFERALQCKSWKCPGYLWRRAIDAASLLSDHSLAEALCCEMLRTGDPSVHEIISSTKLHRRSDPVRKAYSDWLSTSVPSIAEKWSASLEILEAANKARDVQLAETCLDRLESMALNDQGRRHHLLRLLENQDFHAPVWDREDAISARVMLMERDGNFGGAVELLRDAFYEMRLAGTPLAIERAHRILDQMRELNAAASDIDELRSLIDDREPQPRTQCQVRILYVGGNETQQQYERSLTEHFSSSTPNLKLAFLFPGWTSNWNDWYDRVERKFETVDAIVLNTLVRTLFGRKVRKLCSELKPWFPCNGRGRQSMELSITAAANFIASRKASQ
jgi:hypothetical protein